MKEISRYDRARLKPYEAVGKVCVDLTDLRTGKIIQRETGKNMIFPDTLYCGGDWINQLNGIMLVMNDDDTPININMPYLLGGTIGYGEPNTAGSGLLRGAYNAANQVLGVCSLNSVRWKFQYDFTGAQAIGIIKNIGLTNQYNSSVNQYTQDQFRITNYAQNKGNYTCDGRYVYQCSTAGIIDKYDVLLGTSALIDVSAVVGAVAGEIKSVGYAPSTGLYYVYVHSATPENRTMHVFTDATFAANSISYSMSNNPNSLAPAMYIYGNKAFVPNTGSNTMIKVDFVNNIAPASQIPGKTWALGAPTFRSESTLGYGKYIFRLSPTSNANGIGFIYDMDKEDLVGSFNTTFNTNQSGVTYNNVCKNPFAQNFIPSATFNRIYNNCAKTAKVLDTPVEKTSANGLTATYELEVFWDL